MSKKVLIAEDDVNFRYFLSERVPWQKIGYEVAAAVLNGREALAYIQENPVDLVLTDISMPIMNGAELTGKLRERFDYLTIVALSAYDNFDYVKDTLMAGADDYLLKQSLSAESILAAIRRIEEKRRKTETAERSAEGRHRYEFYRFLRDGQALSGDGADYFRHYFSGSVTAAIGLFYPNESVNRLRQLLNAYPSSQAATFSLEESQGILVWRCPRQNSRRKLQEALRQFLSDLQGKTKSELTILTGELCDSFRELPESMKKLDAMAELVPYLKSRAYTAADIRPLLGVREASFVFEPRVWCGETREPRTEAVYAKMEEVLQEKMPSPSGIFQSVVNAFSYCTGAAEGSVSNEEYAALAEMTAGAWKLGDKIAAARRYTDKINAERHQDVNNDQIRQAMRYVERHYKDSTMQVEDIARAVSLSSNYLSNLFSEVMSQSLTRYINEVRIEKAKALLKTTNLKVYEIGREVGFQNPSYFSTIFKKITGQSISEYKRNHADKA